MKSIKMTSTQAEIDIPYDYQYTYNERAILNDIPNESSAGYSDHWSEEDLRVATRYSLQRADIRIETGAAHCLVPVGFATADCRLPTASP